MNRTQMFFFGTLAAAALLPTARADATGFTGPTAPGNFTVANTGTLSGSGAVAGTATFSSTQLVMVGSTTSDTTLGCSGGVYSVLSGCQLQVTINLPGRYSFDWAYTTADADGPAGDMFGVIVNGTRTTLSDLGGAVSQSGTHATFDATTSFGWFLNCTDCLGGTASVTISNFNLVPVPEPAAWALWLGGGVLALGLSRRRR